MKPNLPDLLPLPNPWICDPNGYIAMQMKDYARANQLAAYKAGLERAADICEGTAYDWAECSAAIYMEIRALGEGI